MSTPLPQLLEMADWGSWEEAGLNDAIRYCRGSKRLQIPEHWRRFDAWAFPTSSEKWLASQYFWGIVSVSMFHSTYDETLKLQSCLGQGAITSNKTGYTCDDLGGSKSQIQKRAMLFKNF
jgi:hypothetical protein